MTNVLITGANGFLGRNLRATLRVRDDVRLLLYDIDNQPSDLDGFLGEADVVCHLAGVNRPRDDAEFHTGNVGLTETICGRLGDLAKATKIVFSSSIQAERDNPYGRSKLAAERVLESYAHDTGAPVAIFRFRNLFGKWSRPNYNSVVATFCHNIARDLPITVSDPDHEIELVYVDDAVSALVDAIDDDTGGLQRPEAGPPHRVTLGALVDQLHAFRAMRSTPFLPDFSDRFARCLYATYLSYLPTDGLCYDLEVHADQRGGLAEFVKSAPGGQIFVSRTHPGITRGGHYHHTKTEKFLVLEGDALIRFRHIMGDDILEYPASGDDFRVLDIPSGYTHDITNVGQSELVVLFWASEPFDPAHPDTYYEAVSQ